MGWQSRSGRSYYYRRGERRSTRQYIGSGPVAEIVANLDAIDRAEFLVRRAAELQLRRRCKEADSAVSAAQVAISALVARLRIILGYHRQDRGRWRKRRRQCAEAKSMEAPMEESSIDSNQSVGEARGLLDQAESAWLSLMSGGDASVRDALSTQLAQSLSDLAEPGDTPLVALLVRQVALTQLQAAFADATYALCKDVSLPQAKFLLERQRIMSRKLLQSTKALAEVRKLTNRSIRRPKEASASPPS